MFDALKNIPRLLMRQELRPMQGDRFQPTGFSDLGAALYEAANGTRVILVETAQSMANRMEAVCLDGFGPDVMNTLKGLPYVRVKLTGAVESATSSLIEAHRINSPYIITDDDFRAAFVKASGYSKGRPLDWKKIAAAIFRYDVNTLLHGVFMANLEDGRVKLPRAVTGFIEARDVKEAASGGVKNNPLDPTGTIRAKGYDKNVYGNVPYARMEFTALEIAAYFNVDLALIRGYGLPEQAEQLLLALALYKVRRFLNCGLRLRTACDFRAEGELTVQSPQGFVVPEEAKLLPLIQQLISECATANLFTDPPVTELTTICVVKEEKAPAEE